MSYSDLQLTSSATVVTPADEMPERLLHGLRITELMYHPSGADMPEFIELQNTGDQELDLSGIRLAGGIDFTFPVGTILAAGQYIVVTENVEAFVKAYGAVPRLAGEYAGKLSNGGEQVILQFASPLDTAILRFEYDANWYPATDGGGSSLNVVDSGADYRRWGDAAQWTATAPSPGRESGAPIEGDINSDGIVDATDIDLLCAGIQANQTELDLNGDGKIDRSDMSYLIHDILRTTAGDANLNRVFDSGDLVEVFVAGQYEDNIVGNSGWATGDWDCDGDFTTSDLVAAFQEGGYVAAANPAGSRTAIAAFPSDDFPVSPNFLLSLAATDPSGEDFKKTPVSTNVIPTSTAVNRLGIPTSRIRQLDPVACDQIWETDSVDFIPEVGQRHNPGDDDDVKRRLLRPSLTAVTPTNVNILIAERS